MAVGVRSVMVDGAAVIKVGIPSTAEVVVATAAQLTEMLLTETLPALSAGFALTEAIGNRSEENRESE
jgi:hypothetical protein